MTTSLGSNEQNLVIRKASKTELDQVIATGQVTPPEPLGTEENPELQTVPRTPRANPAMGHYSNALNNKLPQLTPEEKIIKDIFDYAINIRNWHGWTEYISRSIRQGSEAYELMRVIKLSKGKINVKDITQSDSFCMALWGKQRYQLKKKLLIESKNPVQYLLDEMG